MDRAMDVKFSSDNVDGVVRDTVTICSPPPPYNALPPGATLHPGQAATFSQRPPAVDGQSGTPGWAKQPMKPCPDPEPLPLERGLTGLDFRQHLIPLKEKLSAKKIAILALVVSLFVLGVIVGIVLGVSAGKQPDGGTSDKGSIDGSSQHQTGPPNSETTSLPPTISETSPTTTDASPSENTTPTSATASTSTTAPANTAVTIGSWGDWGEWSACDTTCGEGVHTRYRSCNQGNTDFPCQGSYVETELCTVAVCPVFGVWSSWGSWDSCDVSCGGGTQSRSRTCTKSSNTDEDCTGQTTMMQDCNSWNCPDCSQSCASGTLSADCYTCECPGTATVQVKTTDSVPVYGASVYHASSPTVVLATTDETGTATLTNACINSEILVSRSGFQETTVTMTSTSFDITLQTIVYPHFTLMPKSKGRLAGESVVFCCQAVGSPTITYYEWFKNGQVLDSSLYTNGTHLQLTSLTTQDGGEYKCRANSPVGSTMSDVATLSVKTTSSAFCASSLEQRRTQLPSDCIQPDTNTSTFEVGYCSPTKCRQDDATDAGTCGEGTPSCCAAGETEFVTVECPEYNLSVMVIKSCVCSECTQPTFTLSGTALGYGDDAPLRYGQVWVNGVFEDIYTSSTGSFSLTLSDVSERVSLTFKDTTYREFLDMVKVVEIDESMSDLVVTVRLIRAADPVQISSTQENTLYCGSGATNQSASVASVNIPANAFRSLDGTEYTGTVSASLTFISSTNTDVMPGIFEVVDEEGETQPLQTAGVFKMSFTSEDGAALYVNQPIEVSLNTDNIDTSAGTYQLYGLNPDTGKWVEMPGSGGSRKRRRRNTKYVMGEIDVNAYDWWYNIDRLYKYYTLCYFMPKVFRNAYDENIGDELQVFEYRRIMLNYVLTTSDMAAVRGSRYVNQARTNRRCLFMFCGDLEGKFQLEMKRTSQYETVSVQNPSTGPARPFNDYTVSDNGLVMSVRLTPTSNGPFFTSRNKCQTTGDENPFYFYPELPSENVFTFKLRKGVLPGYDIQKLDEYDADTWLLGDVGTHSKICFLKVKVTGETGSVSFRAVSVPTSTGNVAGIREVTPDADGIACMEYRCSGPGDLTNLTVEPFVPDGMQCSVVYDNEDLLNAAAGSTSSLNSGSFELAMPSDQTVTHGSFTNDILLVNSITTYDHISGSTEMENARQRCKTGKDLHIGSTHDADLNKAVEFNCESQRRLCAFWFNGRCIFFFG